MNSSFQDFVTISELNDREATALLAILQDDTLMELAKLIAHTCFFPGGGTLPPLHQDETALSKAWFGAAYLSFDDSRERYRQLGFPEEVWRESMTDLKLWLRYTERNEGIIGIWRHPRDWQMAIYRGEVTRHGRLECNTEYHYNRETLFDESGKPILKSGDPVINVHIPEDGPMDIPSCGDSIRRMAAFFAQYRPQYDWKGVLCESWLLDRQLLPMLSKTSNIARFQSLGQHYFVATTDHTVWRIFGSQAPSSSLARNIKQFIQNGGTFMEEGMFIPRQKLEAANFDLSCIL